MNRILVTGGCGFIGSSFVRFQLQSYPSVEVWNLDSLTYAANPDNLADVATDPRYHFVHGDIADRPCVERCLHGGIDAIVNFAAESHVDRSIQDSSPFIRTNVVGTQVLLDVAKSARVKRFLQVSTDEVYGSLGATGAFTESTPLAPNSPYSASKAAADLLIRSYVHTFSFPALTTRCSNNYGPYQFPEKLLPLFISNALNDRPLPVYGDGLQVRDWIHVLDHCRGIDCVLRQGVIGEVYNIGGRCEKPNIEITRAILRILGKPATLIRYVADRPGHDRRYAIDCTKIEQLGWTPQIGFEAGLESTVDWYCSNQDWVERIRSGAYREYYQAQYGSRLA